MVIRWFFIGAKINIFFEISNILLEFVSPASLFVLSPHPGFAVPSLPYFSAMPCLSIPFCMESQGFAFAPSCFTTFIDTAWQTLAAGRWPVLSLMPVHDWSEDFASFVSSSVINRIPVSLGLSLRPTSFPSLPYFSAMPCLSIPFRMESQGFAFAPSCFTTFIYTAWQTLAAGRWLSFL